MADRYCGNCGRELRADDQFCPNCGRPVHEAAQAPTAEAGEPAPPPPQQAGRGAPLPPQPQRSGMSDFRRGVAIGCGISFVLFVVFLLLFPVLMTIL